MRRQGSGFGLVMLVVVLAVVLFLATRAFKSTLPTAQALGKPSSAADDAAATGTSSSGEAIRPSRLPDLKDLKQRTDAHAAQVRDAVESTKD
jgi:predicted lipid-binding transport protein (Tim44 family)